MYPKGSPPCRSSAVGKPCGWCTAVQGSLVSSENRRTPGVDMTLLITTYLQDHHAGSVGGLEAFERVAQNHPDANVRSVVGG